MVSGGICSDSPAETHLISPHPPGKHMNTIQRLRRYIVLFLCQLVLLCGSSTQLFAEDITPPTPGMVPPLPPLLRCSPPEAGAAR